MREPPLERFSGDERRGTLCAVAEFDERDSMDDGLLFLKPLSVLLRCKPGRASKDAFEELVLVRECCVLTILATSFSRNESLNCVSYGCLISMCLLGTGTEVFNDEAGPGFEKLKSMLGSTPPDVDTKEPRRERDTSTALLVAKEDTGPGDVCTPWRA